MTSSITPDQYIYQYRIQLSRAHECFLREPNRINTDAMLRAAVAYHRIIKMMSPYSVHAWDFDSDDSDSDCINALTE